MALPQGEEPVRSTVVQDLSGTTVGRFEIRSRLGAGGMGEVYRAEDKTLKRPVALKRVIPSSGSSAEYRRRILKEAERASRLSDRRIAQIYDVFEEKSEIFLVMEYVEGETLRQRLLRPMNLNEFLGVAVECAQALQSAHERNIIHCDVKPENIMLTSTGDVKVLDFGIAKEVVASDSATASIAGTQTNVIRGTPAYMAPEVLLENEPDARSDIFSLGVVFYEALSGSHPFRAPTLLGTTDNILHVLPPPLEKTHAHIPASVSRIVARMIAKDPLVRYATAERVLQDLTSARSTITPLPLPSPRAAGLPARASNRLKPIAGVVAALMILLGVAALMLWKNRVLPPAAPEAIPATTQLAVLPFVAVGGDAQTAAFARGLVETLTAKLTQLSPGRTLQVVPAGDLLAQRVTTSEQARKEFAVDLVLEGSLQRSGDQVRITYDLANPTTHRQVHAETITADFGDSFGIEDTVVEGAARMLGIAVQGAGHQEAKEHGTQVAQAFTEYLQGRGYLQEYQKIESVNRSIEAFQKATKLDAAYAPAYAGLGDAYWRKYELTKDTSLTNLSRGACLQAVKLNSNLAASHLCLGVLENGTGQFSKAAEEFQRAIAKDPNSEEAYRGLANAYQGLGKPAETEQTFQQAILLRPSNWAPYNWLGNFYANTGEYAKAATMFKRVTVLAPENHRGYANLGAMDFRLQRWEEAEQMFKRSIQLDPNGTAYSNLGTLYFYRGRYAEAAREFEQAVQVAPKNDMWWANLGDAYRWAPGEKEKSPAAYNMAVDLERAQLKVNPKSAETLGTLALSEAKLGKKADAIRSVRRATELEPKNPQYIYFEALVSHLAGDRASALEFLKKAVAEGYPVSEILAEPEWHSLSNDPEFKSIVTVAAKKEN
jgi:tetratricopeptide (TPR) repeat protein/TolB-like protein